MRTNEKKLKEENELLKIRIAQLLRENYRLKSANELYANRIGVNHNGESFRQRAADKQFSDE